MNIAQFSVLHHGRIFFSSFTARNEIKKSSFLQIYDLFRRNHIQSSTSFFFDAIMKKKDPYNSKPHMTGRLSTYKNWLLKKTCRLTTFFPCILCQLDNTILQYTVPLCVSKGSLCDFLRKQTLQSVNELQQWLSFLPHFTNHLQTKS